MDKRKGDEYRITYGEIDFFITEQVFDGYVGMNSEHTHNYYEVFYVEKGSRLLYLNDVPYMLSKEHIAVIPPGFSHKTTSLNGDEQVLKFFGFSKDFFDNYVPNLSTAELFKNNNITMHIAKQDVPVVVSMLDKLSELYTVSKDEFTKAKEQSIVFDMIFNYTDYQVNSVIDDIYDANGDKSKKTKFLLISRYIQKNINKKITLEMLSEAFSISKYEISRNFKEYCGSTFVDYLNTVRINIACSLLSNTNARVEDVAESVGFESIPHFSKTFKRYMGMSPKQFSVSIKKTQD